jgi:hypothetical protein
LSIPVSWDQHFSLLFEVAWTQNRFSKGLSIHFDELTERSWLLIRVSKFINDRLWRSIENCSQLPGCYQKCHEVKWLIKIKCWKKSRDISNKIFYQLIHKIGNSTLHVFHNLYLFFAIVILQMSSFLGGKFKFLKKIFLPPWI